LGELGLDAIETMSLYKGQGDEYISVPLMILMKTIKKDV
jgi:hypothetical protein